MTSQQDHQSRMMILLVIAITIAVPIIAAWKVPYYGDLPKGPYCERRGCCTSRVDSCSEPILGTLCYCDDFCNRTRSDDCCPDYWTFCKGMPSPIEEKACIHKGARFPYKRSVKENCNVCTCERVEDDVQMECEQDECIIDPDLVETINNDQRTVSWHASNYTKFWGHKLSEGIDKRLGTIQPNRTVMHMNPVRRIYDPERLPREFDSRKEWRGLVSEFILDQGWCSSSWAVSTAAVASDRLAIMSKGKENVRLSAQHLLSCNNRGQKSCHGGYLDKAWMFFRKYGVVDEECLPYKGDESKCHISRKGNLLSSGCKPTNPLRKNFYGTGPAYRLGNETDIMYEIMHSGPVQATMKVYQDFFSYRGGVYQHTTGVTFHRTGYHSVRVVGWGEDTSRRPPLKYWIVANSWGYDWGEEGYFKIRRGVDECEIEKYVLGAWPRTIDLGNEI